MALSKDRLMRVLVAHNAYQHRGGEDSVVAAEIKLLNDHGHAVHLFSRNNNELATIDKIAAASNTLWSFRSATDFSRVVGEFQPDIIHVHNTFPLISPALYWAAARRGIPVVQTLHNFRLLCPQAIFLRHEKICEDCVGKLPWRGVTRACYRGSVTQSAVLASMLALHRALGTYRKKVTRYVALNNFCRDKFVQGGLPMQKLVVKPNFVDLPAPSEAREREQFLYVGRLSPEKGIDTLAAALRQLSGVDVAVVGIGPEAIRLQTTTQARLLGFQGEDAVVTAMCASRALLMPSICYESFPRTLVEAYACSLPVITSRLGAMAELIRDGETGLLFEAGNASDLADKMRWALDNPIAMRRMGATARAEYEAKYAPEVNYRQLMEIYSAASAECKRESALQ